jgi:adenylate kinase family enzyme
MNRRSFLISGIPAAGKSTFARRFAQENGYEHIDVDSYGKPLPVERIARGEVVIDWGFPPESAPAVAQIQSLGARLIWFSAQRSLARAKFVAREQNKIERQIPVEAFDQQMDKIEAAGLPKSYVGSPPFQIVNGYDAAGLLRSYEDLLAEILGKG